MNRNFSWSLLLFCASSAASLPAADVDEVVAKLKSADGGERRAGWTAAKELGAEAVLPIAALIDAARGDIPLAGKLALRKLAHGTEAGSERRTAVSTAIAEALGAKDLSLFARRELAELLGSIGGDEAVPALERLLRESRLRDVARRALERVPGAAATRALIGALEGTAGTFHESLISTLGTRGDVTAIGALVKLVQTGAISARVAAARALTRLDHAESLGEIVRVIEIVRGRDQRDLSDDVLGMADRLKAKGEVQSAERIYRGAYENSFIDTIRYASLYALAKDDPARHVGDLLNALDDESEVLRGLAMELLSTGGGKELDGTLVATYGSSSGSRRAGLLRVLSARKADAAPELIKRGLEDESVDVKITALELSGDLASPEVEDLLVEAIEDGGPGVREVAIASYLEMAGALGSENAARARAMYRRILAATNDKGIYGEALVALARIGTPGLGDIIAKANEDPGLTVPATLAKIYRARGEGLYGNTAAALESLNALVASGEGGRKAKDLALQTIIELGGDPAVSQKLRGILTSYWVLGPFPGGTGAEHLDRELSPEEAVDLNEQLDHRNRKRKWREIQSTADDGLVDFEQIFRRTENVIAYAYTELVAADDFPIIFRLGSDDGIKVFLNGEEIHRNPATRGYSRDSDTADGRLKKGKNEILLKISQGGGQWVFAARVTDADGKPIDLRALTK